MAELVVLNGASKIARATVQSLLQKSALRYSSVKILDAHPFRQSVYDWETNQMVGTRINKVMARSAGSIDKHIEGAHHLVYFTHDYYTMASDKNLHLQIASQLAKKHGVNKFVAVTPIEHDLAWSEDSTSFYQKAIDAERAATESNHGATLLKTNLCFGPESHLVHYLSQCALLGKAPYKNLLKANLFNYSPVHTDDLATVLGEALDDRSVTGKFSVSGPERLNLRHIMDHLEVAADRNAGQTRGPMFPPLDYLWDFFVGTSADLNMSRMVDFYEQHVHLQEELHHRPWAKHTPEIKFTDFYSNHKIEEEAYAHPTMPAYRLAHTD
jgi:uncharacterized protein YbjT (DUF2867 family)